MESSLRKKAEVDQIRNNMIKVRGHNRFRPKDGSLKYVSCPDIILLVRRVFLMPLPYNGSK